MMRWRELPLSFGGCSDTAGGMRRMFSVTGLATGTIDQEDDFSLGKVLLKMG